MNFRSAIVLSVYQKSLLLAPKAKQESSTGKIVNLMSIDATRMQVRSLKTSFLERYVIDENAKRVLSWTGFDNICDDDNLWPAPNRLVNLYVVESSRGGNVGWVGGASCFDPLEHCHSENDEEVSKCACHSKG